MLNKFSELAMGFDNVIFDVIEEWGDDLMTISGVNAQDKDGLRAISTFYYNGGNSSDNYTFLENGEVFKVLINTIDDGYTWNGDDAYFKAYKNTVTYLEKIGEIEIENIDFSIDENIENIACQLIEFMREEFA